MFKKLLELFKDPEKIIIKSKERCEIENILKIHAKNLSEPIKKYIKFSNYSNIHLHRSTPAMPASRYLPDKQKFIFSPYEYGPFTFVDITELEKEDFWSAAKGILIWIDETLTNIKICKNKRAKLVKKAQNIIEREEE